MSNFPEYVSSYWHQQYVENNGHSNGIKKGDAMWQRPYAISLTNKKDDHTRMVHTLQ